MEVRELKTKNLVIGAIMGTLLMIIIWAIMGFFSNSLQHGETRMEGNVTFILNGEKQENVDVSELSFEVKKGDIVEFIIPYSEKLDGGKSVIMLIYLSGVEANVGNLKVYSYGMNRIRANKMVGSGYHFIELPDNMDGQDTHIYVYVNEDNAFTSIDEMCVIPSNASYRYFAGKNMVVLFIGVFLAVLGLILTVAGLLATFFDKSFARLPLIGIFSMCMGMWSFSSNKTFQLFVMTFEVGTLFEYILLYASPIPLLWMIYTMRKHENSKKKNVLLTQLILYSTFVAVCMILHFTNIAHLPVTLVYFHIIGAIVLVISTIFGVFMVGNKTRDERLFQMAIYVLIGAITLDLIRFNVQKYILPNSVLLKSSILPVATLVFILTLVLSYIVHLYDLMMTRTEKEMLTQLAYHDNLTGLYNRAKAAERFEEMLANKDEYCLISLDANGLKYVNDTFGHEAGDNMLKTFSKNLHEAFKGVGKCYRMGGDEFLVIVRKKNFSGVDAALAKLDKMQAESCEKEEFEFDASYGVAYSNEVNEESPEKVYAIADDRMYKMKLKKHNSRAAREMEAKKGEKQ